MILYVCRDHHHSLEAFDRAVACEPKAASRAYRARIRRAARLEWSEEVRRSLESVIAYEPGNPRWHVEALRIHAHARDWEAALHHADAVLKVEPRAEQVHMERAAILARLSRYDEALACADTALSLTPERKYRLEAARIAMDAGAYAAAEAYLAQVARAYEGDPSALVGLATLALFRGRLEDAAQKADEVLRHSPDDVGALRTRGGVAVLRGRYDEAFVDLDAALAIDPNDYQARVFRAEALMRVERYDEVREELHRATMCADGYLLVAWILRLLSRMKSGDPQHVLDNYRISELEAGVTELVPEMESDLQSGEHARVETVLEEALRRLAGNRTSMPSHLRDGEPIRLQVRTAPRYGSRRALELVRTASVELALAELDRMVERFPKSSLPVCHRGELRLWMGDLEGARADLEAAIAILPQTRWAWIGLTGVDTLEGDPERALSTSADGVRAMGHTTGFSVYAYRADALRRLGRLEEAEADLDKSLGQHSSRLGSWILLGLVRGARGHDDGLLEVWRHLEDHAIGLLSDAARELGVELWPERDARPEPAAAQRVLEHALYMMRGNRSSTCATYRTEDGGVRYVPRFPHRGRSPHEADADDLASTRTLLMQATGLTRMRRAGDGRRPRPRPRPAPLREPPLSAAQIDEFLDRGFLTLRGCFPREVGEAWVADAVERIRTAPERWVKRYDPANAARSLRGFDPDRPSTWTWPRIDLDGPRRVPFAELSPKLWQAICDLLGGEERVATRTVSDYFILNLDDGADRDDAAPAPGQSSWHLDHPSERTRLDGFDKGLILILLFSDVGPGAGGTYLAPESWRRVARLLRDHPEGVDFVDRAASVDISRACPERHEITGRVGDAVLVHPLMIHSSSFNPSGRIRWMANPMVELVEPIRLDRPDPSQHSVLERSIRAALEDGP
jgi:tetratricopeptide (TPR) repeat protein